MHRRCLSLAHNADFEQIEDITLRVKLEARSEQLDDKSTLRNRKFINYILSFQKK